MMRRAALCVVLLLAITLPSTVGEPGRKLAQDPTSGVQIREDIDFGFFGVLNDGFENVKGSVEECQAECEETDDCKAFTYFVAAAGGILQEGSCFLYNIIPEGRSNQNAISGILPPRVDAADRATCESKEGVSYVGRIILDGNLVRVSSAEECCLRCQENEECIVYTFLGDSGTCWLKKTKVGEVPCDNCASGIVDEGEFADVVMELGEDPPPPSGGGWDVIKTGGLQNTIDETWEILKDPREPMHLGFRHLSFNTFSEDEFVVVELSSMESFVFTVRETNEEEMFHVYEITDHSSGVLQVPPDNVTFIGSFTFMRVFPDIRGGTIVNWGFQGNIGPPELVETATFFFEKFIEVMIQNLKLEFGSADCLSDLTLREPQGTCNNPMDIESGAAFTALNRLKKFDPSYADGDSVPSGSSISARLISNTLSVEGTNEDDATNRLGITDMHIYIGQLLDHDTDLSPKGALVAGDVPFFSLSKDRFFQPFDIEVPADDPDFTGEFQRDVIKFSRGVWQRRDNKDVSPREHLNQLSSFLDLGPVYGNDNVRAAAVRSMEGGKLKTGPDGFLPVNGRDGVGINLENVPNSNASFYVAGDIRCSEDVNLVVVHNLFNVEHNRVAEELDEAFEGSLDDEQLFQYAKAITTAEWQAMIYNEYLPLILCPNDLQASDWRYDPDIEAGVDSFFSTVSFRFGHSMVGNIVWKVKPGSPVPPTEPSERQLLRDTFERVAGDVVDASNWEEYLMGMMWHEARELDTKLVDEMRSFLFTKNRDAPSNDLAAINIQRARDFGLPMYNDAREAHGLKRAKSFADITDDEDLAARMEQVYQGDVDLVDPFIGGLAEKPSKDCRLVGDLFYTSIRDNFRRIRDGDRLFYKGFPFSQELKDKYPRIADIIDDKVKLADIVVRNTGITIDDVGGPDRGNIMVLPKS